jgi:putative endonuclease
VRGFFIKASLVSPMGYHRFCNCFNMSWFVYLLKCHDGTFYTGVTTDISRRVVEHNCGVRGKGAKYTAARLPVSLVYSEAHTDRSAAQIKEAALRRTSHRDKQQLAAQYLATKNTPT